MLTYVYGFMIECCWSYSFEENCGELTRGGKKLIMCSPSLGVVCILGPGLIHGVVDNFHLWDFVEVMIL